MTRKQCYALAATMAVSFVVLLAMQDSLALAALVMFFIALWRVGDAK